MISSVILAHTFISHLLQVVQVYKRKRVADKEKEKEIDKENDSAVANTQQTAVAKPSTTKKGRKNTKSKEEKEEKSDSSTANKVEANCVEKGKNKKQKINDKAVCLFLLSFYQFLFFTFLWSIIVVNTRIHSASSRGNMMIIIKKNTNEIISSFNLILSSLCIKSFPSFSFPPLSLHS